MILQAEGRLFKAMEQLSSSAPVEVTSSECKKLVKDKLFILPNDLFHLVRFQNKMLQRMKAALTATNNKLIENKRSGLSVC